jgi:hypothetical protein
MDDYFKTTLKENAEEHLKKTINSRNKYYLGLGKKWL